jgi:glycosyltransferase involved in cell wall biosynthesis
MDRSGITPYYQAADLLVLPSVGEGFPLVVQEAMACGTPALISEETARGMPEIESVAYVSDPTVETLAARLRDILNSPEEHKARRDAVARFARRHWSWDQCADAYERLLSQLSG